MDIDFDKLIVVEVPFGNQLIFIRELDEKTIICKNENFDNSVLVSKSLIKRPTYITENQLKSPLLDLSKNVIMEAAIMHDSKIYRGFRHDDALKKIPNWNKVDRVSGEIIFGFVTRDGKFLDKVEAGRVAYEVGQTTTYEVGLVSEHLYLNECKRLFWMNSDFETALANLKILHEYIFYMLARRAK